MGKFTQSVRRIVADVKDEGTMSGLSREEVIDINERLILFRVRLEMSYETAKQALNSLMAQYGDSKSHKNIFNRYPLLKVMIKVCSEPEKLISLSVNNHSFASSSSSSTNIFRKSSNSKLNIGHSSRSPSRRSRKPSRLSSCERAQSWRRHKSRSRRRHKSCPRRRQRRKSAWSAWIL
jgi:hypothetical protein